MPSENEYWDAASGMPSELKELPSSMDSNPCAVESREKPKAPDPRERGRGSGPG